MSDKVIKTIFPDRVQYTLEAKFHRVDGPAIEYVSGIKEYWVDGECLDFITNDQMLIYYLKYGFLK